MSIHPSPSWKTQLKQWVAVEQVHQHEDKLFLVLTLAIGAVVGLVVAAFILLTENLSSRMYPAGGTAWRRLVIPTVGSLVTGFLLYRYFPGARGSGIPQTKTALFLEEGVILFRTVLGRFGVSSLSLASGIALGREGPSVQVGAGIASVLGRWLGLGPSKVKALIPIGAAAALAAAFNTPVAAVLFTLEEVMGDLHAPVLGSIVLSSATSWIVLHLVLGDEPLFHVPSYQLVHPLEFLGYALLGTVGGFVSVFFVKLLLWIRKFFLLLPKWTVWFQPVAGGLLVGVLAWFFPDVLGVGYSHVGQALNSQLTLTTMALLVVLKIFATATCYSSGNAGGIFGPSLFIGAMMGGALGSGAHSLFPDYTGSTGAYALVGMGAAFAGIVRVPLTSVIMIFEMTRDYTIIVPLMISNLISYFISQRLQREPIYEALQHQEGIHLPPSRSHREGVLLVKEAARSAFAPLHTTDTLGDALSRMDPERNAWPVVQNDVLIGMVTLKKVQDAAARHDVQTPDILLPLLDAQSELHSDDLPHVFPDESLDAALRRMADAEVNVLPVVSRNNVKKLVGIISLRGILDTYGLGGKRSRLEEPPTKAVGAPRGLFIGVLASVLGLFIVIGFLNSHYRSVGQERAQNHYQLGNELIRQGRPDEAVEQYRSALSISRQNDDYRVALGMALVDAENPTEAEVYLLSALKAHPDNGRANLGMGRSAARQGSTKDAEDYYHRAIYGAWPLDPAAERLRARFELVDYLEKVGAKTQAVSELLAIPGQAPKDVEVRRRVGTHLLKLGSAGEASEVFRGVLREDDRDADAYVGLGQAQLAVSNYGAALDAFRNALKWDPDNEIAKSRLQVAEKVLAIDPAIRGLSAGERYRRSLRLVELASGLLEECKPVADGVEKLRDTGRQVLKSGQLLRPPAESIEKNVALAEQMFDLDKQLCGNAGHDEALARVLAPSSKQ